MYDCITVLIFYYFSIKKSNGCVVIMDIGIIASCFYYRRIHDHAPNTYGNRGKYQCKTTRKYKQRHVNNCLITLIFFIN